MATSKKQKIAFWILAVLAMIFLVSSPTTAANLAGWSSMNSGTAMDLNGIWGTGGTDAFAVGKSGAILHYDGSTWNLMSSGTTNDLNGTWGTTGKDVFAVGAAGTVIHYNGTAWNSATISSTNDLNGIWGSTGKDVFAVGDAGTIIHYNGTAWSSMTSGTTNDLRGVWGDGADVFAVGKSGTILHYDGSTWTTMSSGITTNLYCIWAASSTDVFAAGSLGTILRYNGSLWRAMRSGTTGDFYGIWGTAGKDVFAVGQSGAIAHYDGITWSSMNRNTVTDMHGVWGLSSFEVFSAGGSGSILRYVPPAITAITPVQGDQGVTMDVSLTGTNLTGATEVSLGPGIAINSFNILNSNQLTANITIVAGSTVGARDVSVTTPGGSYALPASFKVNQSLPTITSVSPNQDRQGANITVTLSGTNLTGTSGVSLGAGIAVKSFSVLSANQLTVNITLAAQAEPGTRDVSVTTTGGSFTLQAGFTVKPALPTLASISPDRGNQETLIDITLAGTNLTGAVDLRLGTGIVVNKFTVLSSNQITANISIATGAIIGARDVSVTTAGGSFTLPSCFTVKQALPAITTISPDKGSQGATLVVTINGVNFIGTSEVRLGTGVAVNNFTIVNANRMEANVTVVAGAGVGPRDVSVTTPGGIFTLPNAFTVGQALPIISSVSPNQGDQDTAIAIIISGNNLAGATSVSFGNGVTIGSFTNMSPTQIKVSLKIDGEAETGWRDISVTTPGGTSTLANSFTVKSKSLGTLFIALIWIGIAIIIALFVIVLNLLRQRRVAKL